MHPLFSKLRELTLAATFLFLMMNAGGCLSFHHGSDLSKLDGFTIVKGTTTEKELVDQFGQPSTTTTSGDGTKTIHWTDTHSDSVVIPGIASSSNVQNRSLSATIQNGIVIDYTISDNHQRL